MLAALCKQAGVKLIYGVNGVANDLALVKLQIAAANAMLPPGCVVTYELGNEPDLKPEYVLLEHVDQFFAIAHGLGTNVCLAGPSFAITPGAAAIHGFLASTAPYLGIVTYHHYEGNGAVGTWTVPVLLQDKFATEAAQAAGPAVEAAHAHKKVIRIDEFNTVYGGGGPGMSDTLGGALWTLHVSFELMAAGLDGINFVGGGELAYSAIREAVDHKGGYIPVVGAPYYAMKMFQQGVAHNVELLRTTLSGVRAYIKVWSLGYGPRATRVVVLNKDVQASGRVRLEGLVPGSTVASILMTAPTLTSTRQISLAN